MVEQNGEITGQNPHLTTKEIATKALSHLTFISPLDSSPLVELFEEKKFPTGATAFRHGDLSTSFSVVAAGELTLTIPNEPHRFLLRSGDYFGQWSLLVPRRHGGEGLVTSQEDLTLLTLEGTTFREFLRNIHSDYPVVEHYRYSEVIKPRAVRQFTPEELDQRTKMTAVVDHVELFQDLSAADKEEVIDLLQERQYPKGQTIFDEGDEGDGLYLLEQGTVITQQTHDGTSVDLTTFNPGDCFGEMALLSDQPRTARALVQSDQGARIFFLPKEGFERLLAGNLNVMRAFVNQMSRRLAEISTIHSR